MQDEIIRILSPLLIIASMLAAQAAYPARKDLRLAAIAALLTPPAAATSCHGTRLGNHRGSNCVSSLAQR